MLPLGIVVGCVSLGRVGGVVGKGEGDPYLDDVGVESFSHFLFWRKTSRARGASIELFFRMIKWSNKVRKKLSS